MEKFSELIKGVLGIVEKNRKQGQTLVYLGMKRQAHITLLNYFLNSESS